jgi:hypothetical protein
MVSPPDHDVQRVPSPRNWRDGERHRIAGDEHEEGHQAPANDHLPDPLDVSV